MCIFRYGGDVLNNRGPEKIYPLNVNNASQNPNSGGPSEQGPKKSVPFVIITELVLCVIFAFLAVILAASLCEKRTHGAIEFASPAILAKNAGMTPVSNVDASEIPQSYIDAYPLYDFTKPVPESEPVDYSYFNDTVFIGDSRTQGLLLYSNLSPRFNFAAQGATTQSIRTKPYIAIIDNAGARTTYTLAEALAAIDGQYKAVYIATGVNELGWNTDLFIDSFRSLILIVREYTDVPIYIQLILPVTTEYAKTSIYGVTNEKQREFNSALTELAAELSVFYLDPCGVCALEDGSLDPQYASFDGAHISPAANTKIAEYYLNHVVDPAAYSNLYQ